MEQTTFLTNVEYRFRERQAIAEIWYNRRMRKQRQRKSGPWRLGFVGQMQYKSHRDKYEGALQYAFRNSDADISLLDLSTYPERLRARVRKLLDFDGLIFGSGKDADSFRGFSRRTGCQAVIIGTPVPRRICGFDPATTIQLDHEAVTTMVVDHFIRRGFRNFAFVGYSPDSWCNLFRISENSSTREHAFANRLSGLGLTYRIKRLHGRLDDEEKRALANWISDLPKPCAIMAYWDYLAREVIDACKSAKIAIPEQVAIIGTDNDEVVCENTVPTISSVEIDFRNAGYLAAKNLCRALAGDLRRKNLTYGPIRIVERASTTDVRGGGRLVTLAGEYIRRHAAEDIRASQVAASVHVSTRVLEKRFKEVLGYGPSELITRCRLETVCKLLRTTSLPIGEVAERSGYSFHHLVDVFKARFGMSMSQFRLKAGQTPCRRS